MGTWNGLAWFLVLGTPVSRTAIVWHLSTVGPVIPPTGVPFATPGIILVGIDLVLRGMRALLIIWITPCSRSLSTGVMIVMYMIA